jgi:hypothetical protein
MLESRYARRLTEIASGGISGRGPSVLCSDGLWAEALDLVETAGSVAVVTGFYIPSAQAPETDGPAGSVALAMALARMGLEAEIWTDSRCLRAMKACAGAVGFPSGKVADVSENIGLVETPDLLIYVERPGRAPDGAYYDMRTRDISAFAAPLDDFALRGASAVIGIGDGGNEVGMGNFRAALAEMRPDYAECLSCVEADVAIPADVSNWGAYALAAALSIERGEWLAHSGPDEVEMMEALARSGAVDGVSKTASASVDGFGIAKQLEIRQALQNLLGGF